VFHADRKGPECIQQLRRHDINHYFGEEASSEDCLTMNIWAPGNAKPNAKLPVIVYIYGGGFTLGSSGMALYGGENVAKSGEAIFVNFNYRVGIMGFMAHPELSAESPHKASGNYGFLDQVAALRWVQSNIAKFGGDPSRVTISGQSAGASSVISLVASPLGKGLFQRAIAMSGSAINGTPPSLAESEKAGLEVQKVLEVKSLHELRQLPADRVFVVQKDSQFGESGTVTIRPNIDGYFLTDSVANIYANGKQNDVPTISGFTQDDIGFSPLRSIQTLAEFKTKAQQIYGANTEQFLRLYPAANDDEAKAMGKLSAREAMMEKASRNLAIAHRKTGRAPFYFYVFSRVHPFNPAAIPFDKPQGAYHTSDVPYWFQTQDALNMFRPTRIWGELDRGLAKQMMGNLLNFAKTGNPATATTPWPAWTNDSERYIEFGDRVSVQTENRERMLFQDLPAVFIPAGTVLPRLTRD
jgi:para-nitrobenzyl esterase